MTRLAELTETAQIIGVDERIISEIYPQLIKLFGEDRGGNYCDRINVGVEALMRAADATSDRFNTGGIMARAHASIAVALLKIPFSASDRHDSIIEQSLVKLENEVRSFVKKRQTSAPVYQPAA